MDIGAVLNEWRKNQGLKVMDIATATRTNERSVRAWFYGEFNPTVETMEQLAEMYPSFRNIVEEWKELRRPLPIHLSDYDLGFIVGMIEGEGTITVISSIRKKRGLELIPKVVIYNNSIDLINECRRIMSGRIIERNRNSSTWSRQYRLEIINFRDIVSLLSTLNPYLISKGEQGKIVKEFCESRLNHYKRPYTQEELNMVSKIRKLNKRGVKQEVNI